jgi:hypothetical protein
MKKLFACILAFVVVITPLVGLAQLQPVAGQDPMPLQPAGGFDCNNNIMDVSSFASLGLCLINRFLIPLLFAVAILVFIWGVVQFIAHADNEEKRTQGRNFMVYGIISLFVMVTIWGLVNVLSNTFGVKTFIPQLQSQ